MQKQDNYHLIFGSEAVPSARGVTFFTPELLKQPRRGNRVFGFHHSPKPAANATGNDKDPIPAQTPRDHTAPFANTSLMKRLAKVPETAHTAHTPGRQVQSTSLPPRGRAILPTIPISQRHASPVGRSTGLQIQTVRPLVRLDGGGLTNRQPLEIGTSGFSSPVLMPNLRGRSVKSNTNRPSQNTALQEPMVLGRQSTTESRQSTLGAPQYVFHRPVFQTGTQTRLAVGREAKLQVSKGVRPMRTFNSSEFYSGEVQYTRTSGMPTASTTASRSTVNNTLAGVSFREITPARTVIVRPPDTATKESTMSSTMNTPGGTCGTLTSTATSCANPGNAGVDLRGQSVAKTLLPRRMKDNMVHFRYAPRTVDDTPPELMLVPRLGTTTRTGRQPTTTMRLKPSPLSRSPSPTRRNAHHVSRNGEGVAAEQQQDKRGGGRAFLWRMCAGAPPTFSRSSNVAQAGANEEGESETFRDHVKKKISAEDQRLEFGGPDRSVIVPLIVGRSLDRVILPDDLESSSGYVVPERGLVTNFVEFGVGCSHNASSGSRPGTASTPLSPISGDAGNVTSAPFVQLNTQNVYLPSHRDQPNGTSQSPLVAHFTRQRVSARKKNGTTSNGESK